MGPLVSSISLLKKDLVVNILLKQWGKEVKWKEVKANAGSGLRYAADLFSGMPHSSHMPPPWQM